MPKRQPNKLKIYGFALLAYWLGGGLVIETLLVDYYQLFPYTRLLLLIAAIAAARRRIAKATA